MTTKLTFQNGETSNGDIHIDIVCGSSLQQATIHPGEEHVAWVSTGHLIVVHETWPTVKPFVAPLPEKLVTLNEAAHGHE